MSDESVVIPLNTKTRSRLERLVAALRAFGKLFLYSWHQTFGYHDPRVRHVAWKDGKRILWLECHCGAEWDALKEPDL